MQCPACHEDHLKPAVLDSGLAAAGCDACGGQWVRRQSYETWRQRDAAEKQADSLPVDHDALAVHDSGAGKFCPDCGTFLIRWRVGHDIPFHLDRCGRCGGIWFDRDEWAALKQRDLQTDVPFIFTDAWQAGIRQAQHVEAEARRLREQLGEVDLQRLRDVQQWLSDHPHRAIILAQLSAVTSS